MGRIVHTLHRDNVTVDECVVRPPSAALLCSCERACQDTDTKCSCVNPHRCLSFPYKITALCGRLCAPFKEMSRHILGRPLGRPGRNFEWSGGVHPQRVRRVPIVTPGWHLRSAWFARSRETLKRGAAGKRKYQNAGPCSGPARRRQDGRRDGRPFE